LRQHGARKGAGDDQLTASEALSGGAAVMYEALMGNGRKLAGRAEHRGDECGK
jgi:hypothetical protein